MSNYAVIKFKIKTLRTFTARESIVSFSALCTFLTNHIVSTLALPAKVGALEAEGAISVTPTSQASIVEVCCQCIHTRATELCVISVK